MSYNYYAPITVDKTKVGEVDANFAVLISGTYDGTGGEPDLRTVANGGNIQNTCVGGAGGGLTIPADLVFSPNTDGSSRYDHEIEKYNAATGEIVAWVQCGVDTAADKTFYMVCGDSGVTTSQENVEGTWDANFVGKWGLHQTGSGAYLVDSTANNNDGTPTGTTQTDGQIGKARSLNGTSDYVSVADNINNGDNDFTVSAWFYANALGDALVSKRDGGATNIEWNIFVVLKPVATIFNSAGTLTNPVTSSVSITTGVWHQLTFVHDKTNGQLRLYLDGALVGTTTKTVTITDSVSPFRIGARHSTLEAFFNGFVDEVRISNIARTANHVTTVFNNQSSPSTFYSVGAEQSKLFTIDAILKGTLSSSFTTDAYLLTRTFTADAILKETQEDSFTADAYLVGSFVADAVLKGTLSSSITTDAVLKEVQSSSLTVDSLLFKITTDTFPADAVLKETQADSFTANAYLVNQAVSPAQYLFTKAGPIYLPVFPLQPVTVLVTTNHTADYRSVILCDASSGSLVVTLPDATDNLNKTYTIKHTSGSHAVVIQGTDTIDGTASQTLNEYDVLRIISDNTEWWII